MAFHFTLFCSERHSGVTDPCSVVVRPLAVADAFGIARTEALDDAHEFVPVGCAEVVRTALFVPAQKRIGQRDTEHLSLRHGHVDKALSQFVVGVAFDPQAMDCAVFGESASGGPNIIRAGHHHRSTASWTIARCASVPDIIVISSS